MSTVTPQTPQLNRRFWRDLEVFARDAVLGLGRRVYVVAGPLFVPTTADPGFAFDTLGASSIPIPTHFFRVLAREVSGGRVEVLAFIVPNEETIPGELSDYLVSIDRAESASGLDLLPLLPPELEAVVGTTLW